MSDFASALKRRVHLIALKRRRNERIACMLEGSDKRWHDLYTVNIILRIVVILAAIIVFGWLKLSH